MKKLQNKKINLTSKMAEPRLAVERALLLKAEKKDNNGIQSESNFYVATKI